MNTRATISARRTRRLQPLAVLAVALAALLAFAAPAFAAQSEYSSWDDFAGKRVGMLTGAPFENAVRAKNPDIGEISYYATMPDMLLALQSNKVDAIVMNEAVSTIAANRNPDVALYPEPIGISDMGTAFPKNSQWHDLFEGAVNELIADGTAEALWQKWLGADDAAKTVLEQTWPGSAGTLRLAACTSLEPCSYLGESGLLGFDIDIMLHAAEKLDVRIEFLPMEFSEILASLEAGKADAGCGSMVITEERTKLADFVVTHANNPVLITRAAAGGAAASESAKGLDSLTGAKIAFINGSVYDQAIAERVEGTTALWFASFADCLAAVRSDKADAACQLTPICELAALRSDGALTMLPERVKDVDESYFFPHGSPFVEQFNELIRRFEADGTLKALEEKWIRGDDANKTLPEQDWAAPNGELDFATSGVLEPLSYPGEQGIATGYDVELALLIARELGYHLNVTMVPMDSIFAEVSTGKADFGGALTVTPERAEMVDFTDSIIDIGVGVVVKSDGAKQTGFFEGLAASFERTFITENRWQLILSGLGVTLLISVCAGALGTGLGFLTVLARRKGGALAEKIISGYQILMGRLPIVVVLMVFYYLVFGRVDAPGALVAIIVFTLSFGAASGNIMWNAVSAIGTGQQEASLALGFNDTETFFNVILPQAARQFIPLLQSQFVSLVKDTAVVGYIAVVDLTRAGDLIRSRTMEAFFPLFSTAIVYFALCTLLVFATKRLSKRFDYTQRERTIEGVEL